LLHFRAGITVKKIKQLVFSLKKNTQVKLGKVSLHLVKTTSTFQICLDDRRAGGSLGKTGCE